MAVLLIESNAHKYTALSTDIVGGVIDSIKNCGALVYLTDTKTWKIVNADLTLSDYIINSDITVGDVEIGAVEIKNPTDDTRATVGANGLYVDIRNIQAGSNVIGKVTIDQTSTGVTNGMSGTRKNDGTDTSAGKFHLTVGGSDGTYSRPIYLDSNGKIVLGSGGQVGYTLEKASVSFNRPTEATPTQYSIGDAVTNSASTPTVFQIDLASVGAIVGQSIEIRKIAIVSSAKQATLPLFNVYLSPTTFTATNDNAALDIDDTTMEGGGAWFSCDTQNYTASNSRVSVLNTHEPMILAVADTKIYGTIQAANAYTPVSSEKFTIIVWVALL